MRAWLGVLVCGLPWVARAQSPATGEVPAVMDRVAMAQVAAAITACTTRTGLPVPSTLRLFLDPQGRLAQVDFGLPFRAPRDPVQACIHNEVPRVHLFPAGGPLAVSWPDPTKPQPFPPVATPLPPWMLLAAGLRCPAEASVEHPPATPCTTADGEQVLFARERWSPNKAVLTLAGQAALKAVGQLLQDVPAIELVELANHEAAPREAYGMKLSQRRAEVVQAFLVQRMGIDPKRLEARGYGHDRPLGDPRTAAGRQLNLRTEIIIRSWSASP